MFRKKEILGIEHDINTKNVIQNSKIIKYYNSQHPRVLIFTLQNCF